VSKAGAVKAIVDAVFQDGVFKPERRPDLSEGERVRITVETVGRSKPDNILHLAACVFEGLSTKDIDEIEEMARHRTLFTDAHL
jgi:predicted DNA-binding antitoxin AbrB/MazE fold protein